VVIVDSSSTIMSAQKLIQKIQDKLLSFYALNISTLQHQRRHLNPQIEKINKDIISKTTTLDNQILELKNSGYHVIVDDFDTDKPIIIRLS